MVPPSKQAEHEELVARVHAGESFAGHQTVRQRKDGTFFEVMMAAAPVQDDAGEVVSHLVVYNDISVVKQQEARLQALIDSSPLALVEFGLDTRVRLWNPAAERIFGWSREEILGVDGLPMAPASRRAEAEELFARVLAGESVNDFETVRQRKDGSARRRLDRVRSDQGRNRPRRREHGRVHRHHGAEGAGGRGPPSERRAPRAARRARRVSSADRHRGRRRTPPARAEPPRRRAAAPGRAVLVPSPHGGAGSTPIRTP